jgi:hypothetical protein
MLSPLFAEPSILWPGILCPDDQDGRPQLNTLIAKKLFVYCRSHHIFDQFETIESALVADDSHGNSEGVDVCTRARNEAPDPDGPSFLSR